MANAKLTEQENRWVMEAHEYHASTSAVASLDPSGAESLRNSVTYALDDLQAEGSHRNLIRAAAQVAGCAEIEDIDSRENVEVLNGMIVNVPVPGREIIHMQQGLLRKQEGAIVYLVDRFFLGHVSNCMLEELIRSRVRREGMAAVVKNNMGNLMDRVPQEVIAQAERIILCSSMGDRIAIRMRDSDAKANKEKGDAERK